MDAVRTLAATRQGSRLCVTAQVASSIEPPFGSARARTLGTPGFEDATTPAMGRPCPARRQRVSRCAGNPVGPSLSCPPTDLDSSLALTDLSPLAIVPIMLTPHNSRGAKWAAAFGLLGFPPTSDGGSTSDGGVAPRLTVGTAAHAAFGCSGAWDRSLASRPAARSIRPAEHRHSPGSVGRRHTPGLHANWRPGVYDWSGFERFRPRPRSPSKRFNSATSSLLSRSSCAGASVALMRSSVDPSARSGPS